MKISNRITVLVFMLISGIYFSQPPVTPPGPPGDGFPGTPGAPASPIDDYIFLLLPLAIMMVVYFAYRYRKQLS